MKFHICFMDCGDALTGCLRAVGARTGGGGEGPAGPGRVEVNTAVRSESEGTRAIMRAIVHMCYMSSGCQPRRSRPAS